MRLSSGEATMFGRGRLVLLVPNRSGGYDEAADWIRERATLSGQPVALSVVLRQGTKRPDDQTQKEIDRCMSGLSPDLVCNATLICGTGFFASIFISLMSRVLIRAKHGVPQALHTDLGAAATWIHRHLADPSVSADEIVDTLSWGLREAH